MTVSNDEQQALQDSKSATLRELGLFIVKSAFALNSAAAIALIPLAGAALQKDGSAGKVLLDAISKAGYCFIFGAVLSLCVAVLAHYRLMKSWIDNKRPEGSSSKRALVASSAAFLFALPSGPFLYGVHILLSSLGGLPLRAD